MLRALKGCVALWESYALLVANYAIHRSETFMGRRASLDLKNLTPQSPPPPSTLLQMEIWSPLVQLAQLYHLTHSVIPKTQLATTEASRSFESISSDVSRLCFFLPRTTKFEATIEVNVHMQTFATAIFIEYSFSWFTQFFGWLAVLREKFYHKCFKVGFILSFQIVV